MNGAGMKHWIQGTYPQGFLHFAFYGKRHKTKKKYVQYASTYF